VPGVAAALRALGAWAGRPAVGAVDEGLAIGRQSRGFASPVRMILTGWPPAITCPLPAAAYLEVGPKWTVPTGARLVCALPMLGASRIHSAEEREEL